MKWISIIFLALTVTRQARISPQFREYLLDIQGSRQLVYTFASSVGEPEEVAEPAKSGEPERFAERPEEADVEPEEPTGPDGMEEVADVPGVSAAVEPEEPTGPAGMGRPRSSSVSADFCTTRRPTPATGLRT